MKIVIEGFDSHNLVTLYSNTFVKYLSHVRITVHAYRKNLQEDIEGGKNTEEVHPTGGTDTINTVAVFQLFWISKTTAKFY